MLRSKDLEVQGGKLNNVARYKLLEHVHECSKYCDTIIEAQNHCDKFFWWLQFNCGAIFLICFAIVVIVKWGFPFFQDTVIEVVISKILKLKPINVVVVKTNTLIYFLCDPKFGIFALSLISLIKEIEKNIKLNSRSIFISSFLPIFLFIFSITYYESI